MENVLLNIQRLVRCKEKVKILEGLRQQEAVHVVRLLFGHDTFQPCVGDVRATVFHKILEHLLAHRQVFRVFGRLIEDVCRFDDLGAERIAAADDLTRFVIVNLWLDPMYLPHFEHRILQRPRTVEIAIKCE